MRNIAEEYLFWSQVPLKFSPGFVDILVAEEYNQNQARCTYLAGVSGFSGVSRSFLASGGVRMDTITSGGVGSVESLSVGQISVRDLQDDRRTTVFDHAVSLGRMDFPSARELARRICEIDGWIFHAVGRWGVREYPVA